MRLFASIPIQLLVSLFYHFRPVAGCNLISAYEALSRQNPLRRPFEEIRSDIARVPHIDKQSSVRVAGRVDGSGRVLAIGDVHAADLNEKRTRKRCSTQEFRVPTGVQRLPLPCPPEPLPTQSLVSFRSPQDLPLLFPRRHSPPSCPTHTTPTSL